MHWEDPDEVVVNPTKLVHEAGLATGLLTDVRMAPLGYEEARRRFRVVARPLPVELERALSEEMTTELADLLSLPSPDTPSDEELRIP